MKKRNKHIGSSLEDFLKEEGVLEETRAVALKETLAWQVQQAMAKDKISKVEMARRMNTSRAALDRLLDPRNASVTLQTLPRAAQAIGRALEIAVRRALDHGRSQQSGCSSRNRGAVSVEIAD